MTFTENSSQEGPTCVQSLLARLDQAGRNLSDGRPEGPYMLEALLQDVRLCPSIGGGPDAPGVAELTRLLDAARDAAAVALACPAGSRDFAIERLRSAITAAQAVVARRVGEADLAGDRSPLTSSRCNGCAFAQ